MLAAAPPAVFHALGEADCPHTVDRVWQLSGCDAVVHSISSLFTHMRKQQVVLHVCVRACALQFVSAETESTPPRNVQFIVLKCASANMFIHLHAAAEGGQHTGAAEEPCTSAARARTQAAWEREVAGMAAEQDASAAHAMSVCGAALGLSHQQILWGLGQVGDVNLVSDPHARI